MFVIYKAYFGIAAVTWAETPSGLDKAESAVWCVCTIRSGRPSPKGVKLYFVA